MRIWNVLTVIFSQEYYTLCTTYATCRSTNYHAELQTGIFARENSYWKKKMVIKQFVGRSEFKRVTALFDSCCVEKFDTLATE